MKKQDYLYGPNVDVPMIPKEIIRNRVEILEQHLEGLRDVPYMKRDGARCDAVSAAIKFWEGINDGH